MLFYLLYVFLDPAQYLGIACRVLLQVLEVESEVLKDLSIVLHDGIQALDDMGLYWCRIKTGSAYQRMLTLSDVNL